MIGSKLNKKSIAFLSIQLTANVCNCEWREFMLNGNENKTPPYTSGGIYLQSYYCFFFGTGS